MLKLQKEEEEETPVTDAIYVSATGSDSNDGSSEDTN